MFHPLEVCEAIAEKLKCPNELQRQIELSISQNKYLKSVWQHDSFMDGMPGIAYFYGLMDLAFPGENWKIYSEKYIRLSLDSIKKQQATNCSLMTGITGIGHALHVSSHAMLAEIDQFIIDKVYQVFLPKGKEYENPETPTPPNYYNFVQGLSGILTYLIARKEIFHLWKLAEETIEQLCRVLLCEKKGGLPGWYVDDQYLFEKEKRICPQGGFFLSFPLGISGCLAMLSTAGLEKISTPNLLHTISLIANWLKEQIDIMLKQNVWKIIIPINMGIDDVVDTAQSSWAIGWPAILRSLFLAGMAINDVDLKQYAASLYETLFDKFKDRVISPSFSMGSAGLLATSYSMAKDTNNYAFMGKLRSLEQSIALAFDPNSPFGFETMMFRKSDEIMITHDPGLLNGSLGIALSFLFTQENLISTSNRHIFIP